MRTERVRSSSVGAAFCLTLLVGCATAPTNAAEVVSAGSMAFRIVASPSGAPLSGVDVRIVSSAGVRPVGQTDRFGVLEVSIDSFAEISEGAVVLCHPDFFCGAVLLSDDFWKYREHLHALAPAMFP